MTTARLIDTSEVEENQSRASNWIKVACVLAASTGIGVFLSRYVSMSITMLLTFYSLLGTLLVTGLGLHRLWLDHRGPTVHIDEGGVAVYPTLTAIRLSYVFMIAVATWGPAAIVFYVLRPDSVGGIVLGISFSFLGYVLLRRTPYRPSNIHHSPIITLTPTPERCRHHNPVGQAAAHRGHRAGEDNLRQLQPATCIRSRHQGYAAPRHDGVTPTILAA